MATKKSVSAAVKSAAKPSMSKSGVTAKATTKSVEKPKETKEKRVTVCSFILDTLIARTMTDDELYAAACKIKHISPHLISGARSGLNSGRFRPDSARAPIPRLVRNDAGELVPYVKGASKATRKSKSGEAKSALVAAGVLPASNDKSERAELIRKGLVVPAAKPVAAAKKRGK